MALPLVYRFWSSDVCGGLNLAPGGLCTKSYNEGRGSCLHADAVSTEVPGPRQQAAWLRSGLTRCVSAPTQKTCVSTWTPA